MDAPLHASARLDWPIALGIAAAAGVALAAIGDGPSVWAGWRPASCLPEACFCEATRDRLIRQPANTLSSLLFVAPALVILRRGVPNPIMARLYGTALLLIGLGSAFFHASLTFAGQTADVLGMYLVATFAVLEVAARRFGWSGRAVAACYLAGNAGLLGLLILAPGLRRYGFGALIVTVIGLELGGPRPPGRELLGAAVGCLEVGFVIWTLDLARLVCDPNHWLQGHAIWHGLSAVSATLFFAYASRSAVART